MQELKNHASNIPSQVVRHTMTEINKNFSNTIYFIKEIDRSIPELSCSLFALNKIFALITGCSTLSQLNEEFPLINDFGVSLLILFFHKPTNQKLDYKLLPAATAIIGSKIWSLKLFKMVLGVHWM